MILEMSKEIYKVGESKSLYYDISEQKNFYWWTPLGFYQRLKQSHLFQILKVDGPLSVDDVDSTVKIFALVNALVLSVPYSMLTTGLAGQWDWLETALLSCDSAPDGGSSTPEEYFSFMYDFLCTLLMCNIYFPVATLSMTMLYFLLRPMKIPTGVGVNDSRDFKLWWKRGRFRFGLLFLGTMTSVILLIFSTNVYYQNFFTPTDRLCTHTAKRVSLFGAGWQLMVALLLSILYFMILR